MLDDDIGSDETVFEEDLLVGINPKTIEQDERIQSEKWAKRYQPVFKMWKILIRFAVLKPSEAQFELLERSWKHIIGKCLNEKPVLQKLLTDMYNKHEPPWKTDLNDETRQEWAMKFAYVIMQLRGSLFGGFSGRHFSEGKQPENFYTDVKKVLDVYVFGQKEWSPEFKTAFYRARKVCDCAEPLSYIGG
ncbi:hypothetical protein T440DRAFT_388738 [Plenodomus tracheiphilus IPT5]|uniref:Uncharacterized protein n=1 Tax=Plenodomus tracheiphilus IPT5 TaxID=1408161 RepID=A0A6A7BFK4_9PLEO|nr:hypothetical protein T440DRAFT_388738 [Plenodomus tracheiphilus IPT5]